MYAVGHECVRFCVCPCLYMSTLVYISSCIYLLLYMSSLVYVSSCIDVCACIDVCMCACVCGIAMCTFQIYRFQSDQRVSRRCINSCRLSFAVDSQGVAIQESPYLMVVEIAQGS